MRLLPFLLEGDWYRLSKPSVGRRSLFWNQKRSGNLPNSIFLLESRKIKHAKIITNAKNNLYVFRETKFLWRSRERYRMLWVSSYELHCTYPFGCRQIAYERCNLLKQRCTMDLRASKRHNFRCLRVRSLWVYSPRVCCWRCIYNCSSRMQLIQTRYQSDRLRANVTLRLEQ